MLLALLTSKLLRRALLVMLLVVVVSNWTWARIPGEPAAGGKFITVDHTRIHYIDHPGADPAVVMIHGLPGTAHDWDAVSKLLPGRHTIAIDRPGYGYSQKGYMPFEQQAVLIKALIDKLHLDRPVIAGHSYGGTLAIEFAERYPSATRGVVLVDAAASDHDRSTLKEKIQANFELASQAPVVEPIADAIFSQLARTLSADSGDKQAFTPNAVDPAHKHRLLAINMQHGDLNAWAHEELNFNRVVDELNRGMGNVSVPTWVIQGQQDHLVAPSTGLAITRAMQNARLIRVSGGHMVPYTHPDVVAREIRAALVN